MEGLLTLLAAFLRCALALFRGRSQQLIVELALRQQLAVYAQTKRKPRLRPLDRAFWVALQRLWPRWREVLVIVKPDTVVRWHRKGFSRPHGRPCHGVEISPKATPRSTEATKLADLP